MELADESSPSATPGRRDRSQHLVAVSTVAKNEPSEELLGRPSSTCLDILMNEMKAETTTSMDSRNRREAPPTEEDSMRILMSELDRSNVADEEAALGDSDKRIGEDSGSKEMPHSSPLAARAASVSTHVDPSPAKALEEDTSNNTWNREEHQAPGDMVQEKYHVEEADKKATTAALTDDRNAPSPTKRTRETGLVASVVTVVGPDGEQITGTNTPKTTAQHAEEATTGNVAKMPPTLDDKQDALLQEKHGLSRRKLGSKSPQRTRSNSPKRGRSKSPLLPREKSHGLSTRSKSPRQGRSISPIPRKGRSVSPPPLPSRATTDIGSRRKTYEAKFHGHESTTTKTRGRSPTKTVSEAHLIPISNQQHHGLAEIHGAKSEGHHIGNLHPLHDHSDDEHRNQHMPNTTTAVQDRGTSPKKTAGNHHMPNKTKSSNLGSRKAAFEAKFHGHHHYKDEGRGGASPSRAVSVAHMHNNPQHPTHHGLSEIHGARSEGHHIGNQHPPHCLERDESKLPAQESNESRTHPVEHHLSNTSTNDMGTRRTAFESKFHGNRRHRPHHQEEADTTTRGRSPTTAVSEAHILANRQHDQHRGLSDIAAAKSEGHHLGNLHPPHPVPRDESKSPSTQGRREALEAKLHGINPDLLFVRSEPSNEAPDSPRNRRTDLAARRSASEEQFHNIMARLTPNATPNTSMDIDEDIGNLDSEEALNKLESDKEGSSFDKDHQEPFAAMETPGAFSEDAEGYILGRNRDARYSLLGEQAHEATTTYEAASEDREAAVISTSEGANINNPQQTEDCGQEANKSSPTTAGLVEALPVEDPSLLLDVDIEQVGEQELDEMTEQEDVKFRRALWAAITATSCGLILVITIFLIVYFVALKDRGGEDTPPIPGPPPTMAPTPFYFDVPDYTAQAIINSAATPQSQAYRWLLNDPNLESYPEWRLRQRFALATLYFATTTKGTSFGTVPGEDWTKSRHWLSYEHHECDWWFSRHFESVLVVYTSDSPCGEDGETLERLWLPDNNLHGFVPLELYWLTSLQSLDLRGNDIGSTISSHIGYLTDLQDLVLHANNMMNSTIPTQIGLAANLELIALGENSFSGTLPKELGSLTHLVGMMLEFNQLSGPIPAEFAALEKLEFLWLDGNNLTESIPPQLSRLSSLRYLLLQYNRLTGTIPASLGALSGLFFLSLSWNQLTGPLPPEVGQMTSLEEVLLNDNLLTGTLAEWDGRLSMLHGVNLGNNLLSGSIPSQFGKASGLNELILNQNHFSGSLPSELFSVNYKLGLAVYGNELTGILPTQIGLLSSAGILTMQDNALSGTLPTQLGLLHEMRWLNLTGNLLSGTLPSEIGQLEALLVLHLEDNNFVGPLPTEIGLLGNLTSFRWAGVPAGF